MKKGFLIDMDGVIYKGNATIPGAKEFVEYLKKNNHPFLFLTNNSQRTNRDIVTKLLKMGIEVTESNIFTSAKATALYLARQKTKGTAYVIGEGGLLNALNEIEYSIVDTEPDYVVVGEGRSFTFEMLENAVRMVSKGSKLIATNMDPNCPTEFGLRPGCGAFVKMIEVATGMSAFSPGKPNPIMFRAARKQLDLRTDETTMIGDTMETDILGGVQMGYRTVLVLSGGTKREDLCKFSYQPDVIVESIAQVLESDSAKQKQVI